MGQDYDEFVKLCEEMGEKFVDDHENEQLCETFGPRKEEMNIELSPSHIAEATSIKSIVGIIDEVS